MPHSNNPSEIARKTLIELATRNNRQLLITFSAGVALRHDGEPPEEVIRRADHAMYLAKRAGKNRVQTAD